MGKKRREVPSSHPINQFRDSKRGTITLVFVVNWIKLILPFNIVLQQIQIYRQQIPPSHGIWFANEATDFEDIWDRILQWGHERGKLRLK